MGKSKKITQSHSFAVRRNTIAKKTAENLIKIGSYRPEFDTVIQRYAELQMTYEIVNREWYEKKCPITEYYINKSGDISTRKAILYGSLESIRKELLEYETVLGLTPKSSKAIKPKSLDGKKKSSILDALHEE